MAARPSIPPPGGHCPWNKLPTHLKGYILWLVDVPDRELYIRMDRGKFYYSSKNDSPPIEGNPLYAKFCRDVLDPENGRPNFSNRTGNFINWALERFIGHTLIKFRSAADHWFLVQEYRRSGSPSWVPNITKLSLDLSRQENLATVRRIARRITRYVSRSSSLRLLRLRTSSCFFHGSCWDFDSQAWTLKDFSQFFRLPSRPPPAKVGPTPRVHVQELIDAPRGKILGRNLATFGTWIIQNATPPQDMGLSEALSGGPLASIPPANGTCPWEGLPQELKDYVFYLAYIHSDQQLHIISETHRLRVQAHRARSVCFCCMDYSETHVTQRPETYVERFLVSRRWFEVAWKLFLSQTMLQCHVSDVTQFSPAATAGDPSLLWTREITQLTLSIDKSVNEGHPGMEHLKDLTSLKHLHLRISPLSFSYTDPWEGNVTHTLWNESEFAECGNLWKAPRGCRITVQAIDHGSAVSWVERPSDQGDDHSAYVTQIFASNMIMYGRLLNVHSNEPRLEDEDIPETLEEAKIMIVINGRGLVELLQEVKRERMERKKLGS